MTSTAPISQPVAAPSAEPGERGGRGGSKTTDDNAFSGLLSKMAAGNQDGVRREGKAEGEPSQPEGEHGRRPFVWVAVSAELIGDAPADDAALLAEAVPGAADEPAVTPDGEPPLSIPPAAAANVVTAAQSNMPAPQPGHDEPPLPGNTQRQMPASASPPEIESPESRAPMPRETVNITVVKQETHFAPVMTALLAGRATAPAAGTVAEGRGERPVADEGAGGRAALAETTEAAPAGAKPLILSAVHGAAGSGRGALSSGRGGQHEGMPGFGPMNGMRGEAGTPGADPAMPAGPAAASAGADATAGGVTTSSAVQLIAERIASEAGSEVARASQSSQTAFFAQTSSPLKVLHIQLQPADLGVVTVRMSLKEKTLQIDLEVSRGDTAQLLQRDKEALSSLLRSAGYLVEGMDVRIADPGAPAAQTATGGAQTGPQMQGGGQPGSNHADARSPGGRPGDGTQGNTFGDERYGNDGQAGEPSRGGGGVYV